MLFVFLVLLVMMLMTVGRSTKIAVSIFILAVHTPVGTCGTARSQRQH